MHVLPFAVCEMGYLGVNKVGLPRIRSGHGGVPSCSWAFVKVANASGDRVGRACCHRSRIGLSVGVLVPRCNMCLEEVGMGCVDGVG